MRLAGSRSTVSGRGRGRARVDVVKRKALLLLVPIAVVLAFNSPAYFTSERGRCWEVAVYIIGIACLAGQLSERAHARITS